MRDKCKVVIIIKLLLYLNSDYCQVNPYVKIKCLALTSYIIIYYCILVIIIYHDFLPTPRRGSHVKSDKTHTHQDTPLSPYT